MVTVTVFACCPSAVKTIFTIPWPASVRGSGPMFTWSSPAYPGAAPEYSTGTLKPPTVAVTAAAFQPKEIEIIVSAVTARSARARCATEDRSLLIFVVLPCSRGISRESTQPGFPSGLADASIYNSFFRAVSLLNCTPGIPAAQELGAALAASECNAVLTGL